MKEFTVIIPTEHYTIIDFTQDNMPGVAVINTALRDFESKTVFAWHLSIMIELEDLIENGMPSKEERDIIDPFGDYLNSKIRGYNNDKPNALFLGRITWNSTRELIWRVYNPKPIDSFLKKVIERKDSPRAFDYKMEYDPKWDLTTWQLKEHDKKNNTNS